MDSVAAPSVKLTYTCVICRRQYDPNTATAERRGLCTRACEKVLEKKHGLHRKGSTYLGRAEARRAMWAELRDLRRQTPGADTKGFLREPAGAALALAERT
jgi:hypothetical protein